MRERDSAAVREELARLRAENMRLMRLLELAPKQAAPRRRELAEELGLDRPPGRIVAVDWVPSRPERPEGVVIVYAGGVLSATDIEGIVLGEDELAGYAFVDADEVAGLVTPLLARRIAACIQAVADGTVAALEDGIPAA